MKAIKPIKPIHILALFLLILVAAGVGSCRMDQAASTSEPTEESLEENGGTTLDTDAPSMGIPGASGILLFIDNFQDGDTLGWKITSGWEVQQAGEYYFLLTSELGAAWVPFGYYWEDYLFRTAARLEEGNLLLSFNLTEDGRYILLLREDGVYLVKEQPAQSYELLAHTGPVSLSAWHVLAVANQGGHIQVYVNHELWMDYTDPNPLAHGTVGVSVPDGTRAGIDNVLVVQLTSSLIVDEVVAPEPIVEEPSVEDIIPADAPSPVAQIEPQPAPVETEESTPADVNALPDLVVSNVRFSAGTFWAGIPVSVFVNVRNKGEVATSSFELIWYPDGDVVGCTWNVPSVPPGDDLTSLVCEYTYSAAGNYHHVSIVDTKQEIEESNETNNEQRQQLEVGALTDEASQQQPADSAPPAPVACTTFGVTDTEVWIAWDWPHAEDNVGFRVYEGTNNLVMEYPNIQQRGSYVADLTPGTSYSFDVRAFNQNGESPVNACGFETTTLP